VLSLEEYIARRKQEDGINEFDKESRMENLQTCVGYVFEYFNRYLDITKMEEQTALNNERLEELIFYQYHRAKDIKQKHNLFNLDSLYRRISNKPFMKGKKQELEILMMYFWLHEIEGDEANYWEEYLSKALSL
jgi:hypothetical protein